MRARVAFLGVCRSDFCELSCVPHPPFFFARPSGSGTNQILSQHHCYVPCPLHVCPRFPVPLCSSHQFPLASIEVGGTWEITDRVASKQGIGNSIHFFFPFAPFFLPFPPSASPDIAATTALRTAARPVITSVNSCLQIHFTDVHTSSSIATKYETIIAP
jgi:hypothetical protein